MAHLASCHSLLYHDMYIHITHLYALCLFCYMCGTGNRCSDDTPLSDATECSSDKHTSLKRPVTGVLMNEQDYIQELAQKEMNNSKVNMVT